jgi:pilus assembly protein CpaB
MRSIGPGEPVLASRISDGGRPSVAAMLGPNMTAVSIRISDVSGVAGFVLAGDRVDVILTREVNEEQFTDVLLHNVRVVAIDQQANENRSEMTSGEAATLKTATLEVNQDDAQKLALGSAVGTLTLALRSPRQTQPETAAFSLPLRASQLVGGGTRRVAAQVASQPAPAPRPDLPPRPRPMPIRVASAPPPQPRPSGPLVEVVRGTASRQYEVVPYGGL